MFRLDCLLALTLLTAPPDTAESMSTLRDYAHLRPALQALAMRLEILDPREVRYILTRTEDLQADLNLLRRRHRNLLDAPPLYDSLRFSDRETINEMLSFNRSYRQQLGMRQPMELANWWHYQAALQETDYLYRVWDKIKDARCDYYYVTVRRQALKDLRDLIGPEAYYTGQLPPNVPVWRLQRID